MKYRVCIKDTEVNTEEVYVIEVRRNVSLKTVMLKALNEFVEQYSDPLEFMREIKYLHRESEDESDFAEQLVLDLDLDVTVADLNNHTYTLTEYDEEDGRMRTYRTTSYERGYESYKNAWYDQREDREYGEPDLEKYLPSEDYIIEHGNELMAMAIEEDGWEMEE